MKVFISWSGETSRQLAEALRDWFQSWLPAVKPFCSKPDIEKGARWGHELAAQLEDTSYGIVCLTPDNLTAPWIMFEAGAFAKKLEDARLCPILFGGLKPTDVTGPLAQFQLTPFDKDEMLSLVKSINARLEAGAYVPDRLEAAFSTYWPQLTDRVSDVLSQTVRDSDAAARDPQDIVREILSRVRSLTTPPVDATVSIDDWLVDELSELIVAYRYLVIETDRLGMLPSLDDAMRPIGRRMHDVIMKVPSYTSRTVLLQKLESVRLSRKLRLERKQGPPMQQEPHSD